MTLNEYQIKANRTISPDSSLTVCALGLTGESGEFAEHIKKWLAQGHNLNHSELVKELGDILWYIAAAASILDVSLDTVAHMNVEKLRKRYPKEFKPELSINVRR